jgi:hypothetical protein
MGNLIREEISFEDVIVIGPAMNQTIEDKGDPSSLPRPNTPNGPAAVKAHGQSRWDAPIASVANRGIMIGVAARALRWLELRNLEMDYARMKKRHADDAWWICSDDELRGPVAFRQVLEALVNGVTPLYVLHDSQAQLETPPWVRLKYDPVWLRRGSSLLWTIGFWLMCAIFLFCVVQTIVPRVARPFTGVGYWMVLTVLAARFLFGQQIREIWMRVRPDQES